MKTSSRIKKLLYNEKYHDNCHDYLKTFYVEKYALAEYKPLLYEIRDKIPKLDICGETPISFYDRTIVCDQHAVIFGHEFDTHPILATYALNACIGLVMYAPDHKTAVIAHIDGLPGYSRESAVNEGLDIDFSPVAQNIGMILERIRQLANTNEKIIIEYYLIGGIFDMSEIMISDIINCINQINDNNASYSIIFAARNILGPENQSRNICINSATGKITYFDYITNSEVYKDERSTDGLPLNIIKAPRTTEALLDITYVPQI